MHRRRHYDALAALGLALVLGTIWAWRDWTNLVALRLPDTDDIMRLQQVRDWLGGQPFADLVQHRLAGGLPMHWSRLADLGPAALITMLTPPIGAHAAEVAAVVVWPLILFAVALFLIARLAHRLAVDSLPAMIVAAIGYPATTIFLPGRIDHHGLQIVLLLAAVVGLLGTRRSAAAIAGLCAGASLIVGLETAPMLAGLGAFGIGRWVFSTDGDKRLAAFGIGAFVALLVGRIVFAPYAFAYPACDGFTADAWRAGLTLAAVPILLGGIGSRLAGTRRRAATTIAVCGIAALIALLRSPTCLSPYGQVDPLLARLWLDQVGEAQSILAAPLATSIGYLGVMLAGFAATLWQVRRHRTAGWVLVSLLLAAAIAIATVQLRGAYAGAMLAAPGLAALIAAARARHSLALAGAWLGSAGMLYPLAAEALTPPPAPPASVAGDCSSAATLALLARLPSGTVLAPIDTGAWAIAATSHRLLAAPYHRDTAGNLAMYRFYLGPARGAARRAAASGAGYMMVCGAMPGASRPGTTAAALATGALPGFRTVARSPDGATIVASERLSTGGHTP